MKKVLQIVFVLGLATILAAQDTPKPAAQKIYKATFLIYEVEEGKKINERTYVLPILSVDNKPHDSNIRVGTRVPVAASATQTQYLDVGLSIDCNVTEQADKFIVHTNIDMSSFALPEQGADPRNGGNPILRNVRQTVSTIVSPGKATPLTSIDDVNSKKRLQVEVTVTRIE